MPSVYALEAVQGESEKFRTIELKASIFLHEPFTTIIDLDSVFPSKTENPL